MLPLKHLENLNSGKGLEPNAGMLTEVLRALPTPQQRPCSRGKFPQDQIRCRRVRARAGDERVAVASPLGPRVMRI